MSSHSEKLTIAIGHLQRVISHCDKNQIIGFNWGPGDVYPRLNLKMPEYTRLVNLFGLKGQAAPVGNNTHHSALLNGVEIVTVQRYEPQPIVADASCCVCWPFENESDE